MIPLVLRAEVQGRAEAIVRRTSRVATDDPAEALIVQTPDAVVMQQGNWQARIFGATVDDLAGDVLLLEPGLGRVQRLVRARSKHNTFLITERCDQLCVMCSQPPKKTHVDSFRHYKAAAILAPANAVIGLSGGEPTLYKAELFELIQFAATLRPDLRFHVLTNAQHFAEEDTDFLGSDIGRRIQWGVPLYAEDEDLHDRLVGKVGAYSALMDGLAILCRSGAPTELRTVVMRENVQQLPALARFITAHVPWADPWAIMQLERIGFAKNRWSDLFYDHSIDFQPIADAIEIARLSGMPATLYNFPLCTVPAAYRRFAPSTISDWKRRYEPACEGCIAKSQCGGFFEWHPSNASYRHLGFK